MTTKVIAELGLSHGWGLAQALHYIKLSSLAGADIVKFQCHRGNPLKKTGDFADVIWQTLAGACYGFDIEFACSPFSVEAAEMLEPLVVRWKVASGQVTNLPMLEFLNDTGKPVLISRGLGDFQEFARAQDMLKDVNVTWMLCESTYPTPPHLWPVPDPNCGYSDHSGSIYPGLWAGLVGSPFVEVHVKDDDSVGNDLAASISYAELSYLTHGIKMYQVRQEALRVSPLKTTMREKYLAT